MKSTRLLSLSILSILMISCAPLKPPATIINGSIKSYKYVFISPTKSLSSSSGGSVNGQYYSTSKSVNPSDVMTGILAKEGFILLPELKNEFASQTLIANYGESGRRNRALGYTIDVTIQFISSESSSLICSCTAEGQGSTEADDIRQAISRCLQSLLPEDN